MSGERRRDKRAPFCHSAPMRKFGWIPDAAAKKIKDWNAAPLLAKVAARPAQASLRHLIVEILDQGPLGSCVANAGAQAVRAALVHGGAANPAALSRLFAYYYARAISPGSTQVDSGTEIRCFFDVIRKIGFCPEDAWPYDVAQFARMPPPETHQQAIDQKTAVGYYSITSIGRQRVEDVCNAIAAGHLVVFGTQVGAAFANYAPGAPAVDPPVDWLGGHALCVVGYRPGAAPGTIDFEVVNSWSEGWGDRGFCWMSEAYMAWDETRDLWIVETAPGFGN